MEVSLATALSIGKDNTENITLNGFLASYFNGYIDELEDILIEVVQKKQKNEPNVVDNCIKSYCEVVKNV